MGLSKRQSLSDLIVNRKRIDDRDIIGASTESSESACCVFVARQRSESRHQRDEHEAGVPPHVVCSGLLTEKVNVVALVGLCNLRWLRVQCVRCAR